MSAQDQRKNDEAFMRLAIDEARKGLGFTSPNPTVGAVIVKDGCVLSRGYHHAAGQPHAEIEALAALPRREDAPGSTIYVTLEPCSTHGRTPPCTEAIVAAGLRRVVIGAVDPNPRHFGRAISLLKSAGLQVSGGVLADECAALNRAFNRWIVTRVPWVIAKFAQTLDGRITLPPRAGRWLSGEESRAHAHAQRARVDAILIGAGTLRTDNPQLTARGAAESAARQPWRVIVAGEGDIPESAQILHDAHRDRTLVFRQLPLPEVLRELGNRGVTSVLVEGGARILGSIFDAGLADEVQIYLTPHISGGPICSIAGVSPQFPTLQTVECKRLGPDVFLRSLVCRT